MTDAAAKLPHCKGPDHCHVENRPAGRPIKLTVTKVSQLSCKNTTYNGPGIILAKNASKPLEGLHLLPELIAVLPGQLRSCAAAAKAGQNPAIVHTINGPFEEFAQELAADAVRTAGDIERVWAA